MTKIESAALALDRALMGNEPQEKKNAATEQLLQAIGDGFAAVVYQVPRHFYGTALATARLFVTALELCADEDDLKIAAEVGKMTEAVTINGRRKGDDA